MTDPVVTNLLVGVRQGHAILTHGVREDGGVEVQTAAVLLSQLDPLSEVAGLQLVALDGLAGLADGVVGVDVDLVGTGDQGQSLVQVSEDLLGVAGDAGVVTGGLDTAGQGTHTLKAVDIVCLPAVHGNADILHLGESCLGVHTDLGVHFLGGEITLVLIHLYVPP